jgi:hypothetical protein
MHALSIYNNYNKKVIQYSLLKSLIRKEIIIKIINRNMKLIHQAHISSLLIRRKRK